MGKHDPMNNVPEIQAVKERGKELKKEHPNLSHAQCVELAAREKGFGSYAALRASLKT